MARKVQDKYANILNGVVTTLGVTPVQVEINTGVSLGEGRGILIDQIDYSWSGSVISDFVGGSTNDYMRIAWSTQSMQVAADYDYGNSRLVHMMERYRADFGTAGNAILIDMPNDYQFFPPMIVASPKLFLNCFGSAAITGGKINSRIYFRYVDLSSQEYLELAESFVLVG